MLRLIMHRSRHQCLRRRLSILAIMALLWSQFVMASHPAASMGDIGVGPASTSAASVHPGCHDQAPVDEGVLCKTHCAQGAQNNEIGRIPPIPPLAPAPYASLTLLATPEAGPPSTPEAPPRVSWHRPTLHPANLLLI